MRHWLNKLGPAAVVLVLILWLAHLERSVGDLRRHLAGPMQLQGKNLIIK